MAPPISFLPSEPLLSPSVFDQRNGQAFRSAQQLKNPNIPIPRQLGELAARKAHSQTRGQRLPVGQRIKELFYSRFAYEDDDLIESRWRFHHLLGHGSFGIAAVYNKIDINGNVDKKMVLKAEQHRDEGAVNKVRTDVSSEAFHHAQINKRNNYSNVFLHGYRYHVTDHLVTSPGIVTQNLFRECRYYLEFCERGTLMEIYMKYKAWGYHLPELFIWWVFYWLVRSCRSMEPVVDGENHFMWEGVAGFMGKMPGSFMLHNDLAWRNIFFKHEDSNLRDRKLWDRYPCPKVGDFGLSQVRQKVPDDDDNKPHLTHKGVPIFRAPEKRPMETRTNFYPFWHELFPDALYTDDLLVGDRRVKNAHPILPSANLWGMAFLVYLLMSLEDPADTHILLKDVLEDRGTGFWKIEQEWKKGMDSRRLSQGLYVFPEIDTELPEGECAPYSHELMQLVLDCTRMQPHKRPTLDSVEQAIREGMDREAGRLYDEYGGNLEAILAVTRVQFANEEWNATPKGPFDFVDLEPGDSDLSAPIEEFWDDFHGTFHDNVDPDDEPLLPPEPNIAFLPRFASRDILPNILSRHIGTDRVTYVHEQWKSRLHQGPRLPAGGRAFRMDKESGDDSFSDPMDESE